MAVRLITRAVASGGTPGGSGTRTVWRAGTTPGCDGSSARRVSTDLVALGNSTSRPAATAPPAGTKTPVRSTRIAVATGE